MQKCEKFKCRKKSTRTVTQVWPESALGPDVTNYCDQHAEEYYAEYKRDSIIVIVMAVVIISVLHFLMG